MFSLRKYLLVLLLAVLSLTGCGKKSLEPLAVDATILAFGDSLTAGKGTVADNSYPAVLSRITGRNVINAGISGETSAEGLERLAITLEDANPDLLLLMHGGNDILRNLGAAQAKDNLGKMIELAQAQNIQAVLIGVPERKLFSSVAPYYTELAKEHDLVLEDGIISSLLKKPAMKSDSVHFNSEGYKVIAETIYELLKKHGAL